MCDPIVKHLLKEKGFENSQFKLNDSNSLEQIRSIANLVTDLVGKEYKEECELHIISICKNNGSKKELLTITKLYTAHLVNIGFSKKFIESVIHSVFYQSTINRCSENLLKRYFKNFAPVTPPNEYSLLICGQKKTITYLENMFGMTAFDDADLLNIEYKSNLPVTFGIGEQKKILVIDGIPASDAFSAAKVANTFIGLARSFLFLHPGTLKIKVDDSAFVLQVKSKQHTAVNLSELFQPKHGLVSRKSQEKQSVALVKYLSTSSTGRGSLARQKLMRSLNSINLASVAPEPQTNLISIWAAFEALLPEPTKRRWPHSSHPTFCPSNSSVYCI